jgi:hypothetical protein
LFFLLLVMAITGDGVPLLLMPVVSDGVPSSTYPTLGGEQELLGVAVLSHQCRHPGGFPLLSESDRKERLLMAPSVVEMNGGDRLEIRMGGHGVLLSGDEWWRKNQRGLRLLFHGGL